MNVNGFTWNRNWTLFFILANIVAGGVLIVLGTCWNYLLYSSKIPVSNIPIVDFGITTCGVFVIIISIIGIVGTVKHSDQILLYYIIGMPFVFIALIGVATACLTLSDSVIQHYSRNGWRSVDDTVKYEAQVEYQCCGFDSVSDSRRRLHGLGHPPCFTIAACTRNLHFVCNSEFECCSEDVQECGCETCKTVVEDAVGDVSRLGGQFSRAISLLMMIGPILAGNFRNNHCEIMYQQQ